MAIGYEEWVGFALGSAQERGDGLMTRERFLVSGAIALAVFIAILVLYVLAQVIGKEVVLFATLLGTAVFGLVFVIDALTETK